MKTTLRVALFAAWLIAATTLRAEVTPPSPTERALEACDLAFDACKGTVDSYRQLSAEQDKLIVELTKQRNELAKDNNNGLPFYFWMLVGAAGYVVFDQVRR